MRRACAIRNVIIALIGVFSGGCTEKLIEYRAEPGNTVSISKLTHDEYWKRRVDEHIAAEKAGEEPEGGYRTWGEYYEWWYGVLRRKPKPTWKSHEFKTSEDLVNYIKERRRAKGLRPYD
jgi:hypothetical protein